MWNRDISEAKKGKFKAKTGTDSNGDKYVDRVFVEHRMLIATKCGRVFSSYLTANNRWSGLGEKEVPVAFKEYDPHPDL